MTADQMTFRNQLRVRVCGLLVEKDKVLLAQIHSPITEHLVWTPPGGGLKFRETISDCLKREFAEETNLEVSVQNLIHINELISPPFHALELYFEVKKVSGELEVGRDPELSWNQQLLHDIQWISIDQLKDIDFAPTGLVEKLLQWDNRFDFPVIG